MSDLFVHTVELEIDYSVGTEPTEGDFNMGQLRKLSIPVQDIAGNALQGVAVKILRPGAIVSRSVDSNTIAVKHPGALRSTDSVAVLRSGELLDSITVGMDGGFTWNATAGDWTVDVNIGGDWTPAEGDRLVLRGVNSAEYLKAFDSDLRTGSFTRGAFSTAANGTVSKWVDSLDADIRLDQDSNTYYFVDVATDGRDSVYPEDFGAEGDGATDDTRAIQTALDYASEISGGADVVFSAPSYLTTGNTVTSNSVRLVGYGIPTNIVGGKPRTLFGEGSPEGAVTAPIGSTYMRTDGSTGTTIYSKVSGTGNTGWASLGREVGGIRLVNTAQQLRQLADGYQDISGALESIGLTDNWVQDDFSGLQYNGEKSFGWANFAVEYHCTGTGFTVEWGINKVGTGMLSPAFATSNSVSDETHTVSGLIPVTVTPGDTFKLAFRVNAGSDQTITFENAQFFIDMVS